MKKLKLVQCAGCPDKKENSEIYFYVDGNNEAITKNSKPYCKSCYLKNYGNTITVNGYGIRYNLMWREFQVSHPEIGANLAEFETLNECVEYSNNG